MRDKVLIIDDEEIIRRNLKKLLSLDGYEVFTAENGQQGLDTLKKAEGGKNTPIKVTLLDVKMPSMDGLEVLKRINENTPQTEVIIITGHGGIESAIQALRIGAFDYITKPIEYDELTLSISRALEKYEMQKKLEKALKLFTISSEIHRNLNVDEVYSIILDIIKQIIGGKDCSILIRDVENNKLELAAFTGKKSKEKPLVCYPLKLGSEKIGEIHINSLLPQKDVLTEEDRKILALLAKHTVVAITGVELKNLSMIDGLTGLYNHRHFWERLSQEYKRTKRYLNNLCLMIIDIDFFKTINDSKGHQVGDFILEKVSKIFKERYRESDIIFRYGGDEFAVLLTDTNYYNASTVADNIRKFIENYEFKKGNEIIKITISNGIASLLEDDINNEKEFVEFADKALLYAKSVGRNRSVCYKDIREEYAEINNKGFKIEELTSKIKKVYAGIERNSIDSIITLVKALEARDPYSKDHSINVMNYSLLVAKEMGLPKEEIDIVRNSSLMHDVGKMSISDKILIKKGKLTEEEYAQIKKHPILSARIIKHIKFLEMSLPSILHHHEWYNGNGYPNGLKGNKIPLGSRIIAVADAFEAMSSSRPYRDAFPSEKIVKELVNCTGTQFFPEIVYNFLQVIKKYKLLPELSSIEKAIEKVRKKTQIKLNV